MTDPVGPCGDRTSVGFGTYQCFVVTLSWSNPPRGQAMSDGLRSFPHQYWHGGNRLAVARRWMAGRRCGTSPCGTLVKVGMGRTRWHISGLVLGFLLAACSGTSSSINLPGFKATRGSLQLTLQLPPSRVTGGKSVLASSVPACPSSAIVQTISVAQRRYSASAVHVVFTTTLRPSSGTAPCGIPEFQTCSWPGAIVLANAHGDTVWQWGPPPLGRQCDPTFLQELPMSVSSPLITFVDNLLPTGRYVVRTVDSSARTRFRLR